jgi:hypothetical protein
MSKVADLFDCPRKYFYIHHQHLLPKEEPIYLRFGSLIHSAIEAMGEENDLLAGVNKVALSEFDDENKNLATFLLRVFHGKYAALNPVKMLEQEKPKLFKISDDEDTYFTHWVVKPDRIIMLESGLWLCEYKTTSGYGPSTAAYYHNSLQTLTYFYVTGTFYPDALGTLLFIMTKKGKTKAEEERVMVERIQLSQEDIWRAKSFMEYAIMFANHIEEKQAFYKFQTKCHPFTGGECPYFPLCFTRGKEEYLEEVKTMLFNVRDPDEHLELEL